MKFAEAWISPQPPRCLSTSWGHPAGSSRLEREHQRGNDYVHGFRPGPGVVHQSHSISSLKLLQYPIV